MSDPYYYNPSYPQFANYPPNYPPPDPQCYNWQWNQAYPPMMPPYPPPVNFNVPPPPIAQYNYYPQYPLQDKPEKSSQRPPRDYRQELELYKQKKADKKYRRRSRSPKRRSRSPRRSKYKRRSRSRSRLKEKPTKERDLILSKWRKNYCSTREEVSNKIHELSKVDHEEVLEQEKNIWTRSTPSDLYYRKDESNSKITRATKRLVQICDKFNEELVLRAESVNKLKPKYEPPPRKNRARLCKHKCKFIVGNS